MRKYMRNYAEFVVMVEAVAIAVASILGFGLYLSNKMDSCNQNPVTPQSYSMKVKPIDQVFRDHGGYRIYSRDDKGRVIEESYDDSALPTLSVPQPVRDYFKGLGVSGKAVTVYRDLSLEEQSLEQILTFTIPGCVDRKHAPRLFQYVEIHLSSDQGLEAGQDSYIQGKVRRYEPMVELKVNDGKKIDMSQF